MKYYSDRLQTETKTRSTYRALVITLAGNIFLAIMKLMAAHSSESSALFADAYNSLSDVLYSVMLVIGLYIALRPADLSHPQGHRRFEPLVGMVISFSMAWAGYKALFGAIEKIKNGPEPFAFGMPVIILLLSATIKAVMFLLIRKIAQEVSSPTLNTAAKDNIIDTLTSFTAIAGIGMAQWLNPLADPIAGIIVSIWIFRAAFLALKENLDFLTGGGASQERNQEFQDVIGSVQGVLRVHQIFSEYVGTKYLLDVHVNVDGQTTLNEVHRIESEIEAKLTAMPDVERAYIHIEPPEYD